MMNEKNETLVILALLFIGLISAYKGRWDIVSVVIGALAGYLSHYKLVGGV